MTGQNVNVRSQVTSEIQRSEFIDMQTKLKSIFYLFTNKRNVKNDNSLRQNNSW